MRKSTNAKATFTGAPDTIINAWGGLHAAGLGSLSQLGTKWVETMGDVGAQWLSFLANRAREDVKTQHELLHARTLGDIQHIQAQFLQKAMDDYRNETGKIVQFCAKTMSDIQHQVDNGKDQPKT